MALKTFVNITDDIEMVLRDNANAIWGVSGGDEENDISNAIKDGLREISEYVPYIADHWLTTRRRSKYIDISSISDLIDVNYAIYPILLKDEDNYLIDDGMLDYNRRNVEHYGDTVRMILTRAPEAIETDQLTGTVTFALGSTTVSGSGTAFTTELRAGYYINKSGAIDDFWARVASITDDTNLVLANNSLSDGADTAGATDYWRNDVVINCEKDHYLTEQADLAGAVKVAHAKGVWSITIDGLTDSQVVTKNTMFTIAEVDGEYRSTSSDQTVASNEVTINIEPALLGVAPDNAIVTFRGSSLYPKLERVLTELCAARLAVNKSIDFINAVNIGGVNTTSQMRSWGESKLAIVLAKLARMATVRTFQTYSRGIAGGYYGEFYGGY